MKKSIVIGGLLIGVSVLVVNTPGVKAHFDAAYAAWEDGRLRDHLSPSHFVRWWHQLRGGSASGGGHHAGLDSSPVPASANCPKTSFTPPRLVDPRSPKEFGAAGNGTTDDTKAFQAAVDAGDVLVPAGTYLLNDTVVITASHRRIQCEPGVTLRKTIRKDGNMFNFEGPLTGNSLVGCNFVGANPTRIREWERPGHYDIPVQTNGAVDDFVLAGNSFRDFFGQSMFQTEGQGGGTGDVLVFNSFANCPLYGIALVGSVNGRIAYNLADNCRMGPENNDATQDTGGNVLECNRMINGGNITGGSNGEGGVDYSGNIVRHNILDGGYMQISPPERGKAARYIGNTCNDCATE
ncbi:Pectate lyase superfamily protein [Caballeronia calidae]|uniref:Pectate lyase superfamily protein n=1 Tax=Caballeronia calidae TaxID=1777139 RepID=A0A158EHG7_9BURK|nr:glycosyl hydrolase family 28-related protein [Caballeronia calidae]SAL06305.1 Pectate lyase superfamily protein [Caballeronia calidae]